MKKLNIPLIPIITGSLALIAIVAVIIILTNAGGDAGLYVSEASGGVSITNADNATVDSASGAALNQGDIITVADGASCTLTYKSSKNSDNNYIVVGPGSQLVITDKLTGKNSGQLYLNRGSLICNLAEKDSSELYIRTADSMVYPEGTVSKIAYTTNGFEAYTDVYSFMGRAKIQLYDEQGNTVNGAEILAEKLSGRVTTNDLGPVFSYLNVEFPLNELTAFDLKTLITISALVENFPYTTAELKEVYDSITDNSGPIEATEVTTVITDTSEPIQTAEPIVTTTSPLVVEPPTQTQAPTTTQAPQTTTQAPATTTQAPQTTTAATTTTSSRLVTVIIDIDGDETIQEVPYGGSAEKPSDPVISGKTFIGWDKSFDNIRQDTVITALFEEVPTNAYHTVTVRIADRVTTLQVQDGQDAPLPSTISLDGYVFRGWDTVYTNVKSDITVTAILEPVQSTCVVTFMINGQPFAQIVERGGTAVPPFQPTVDYTGENAFSHWDKPLTNITEDQTITAIFGKSYYTVTFMIDGSAYPVIVANGEDAYPPYTPTVNNLNQPFLYWDKSFYAVSSDMTITAVFATY